MTKALFSPEMFATFAGLVATIIAFTQLIKTLFPRVGIGSLNLWGKFHPSKAQLVSFLMAVTLTLIGKVSNIGIFESTSWIYSSIIGLVAFWCANSTWDTNTFGVIIEWVRSQLYPAPIVNPEDEGQTEK